VAEAAVCMEDQQVRGDVITTAAEFDVIRAST